MKMQKIIPLIYIMSVPVQLLGAPDWTNCLICNAEVLKLVAGQTALPARLQIPSEAIDPDSLSRHNQAQIIEKVRWIESFVLRPTVNRKLLPKDLTGHLGEAFGSVSWGTSFAATLVGVSAEKYLVFNDRDDREVVWIAEIYGKHVQLSVGLVVGEGIYQILPYSLRGSFTEPQVIAVLISWTQNELSADSLFKKDKNKDETSSSSMKKSTEVQKAK